MVQLMGNKENVVMKQGRKLSGKKRAEAERLGISSATQEGTEQMLYELEQLRARSASRCVQGARYLPVNTWKNKPARAAAEAAPSLFSMSMQRVTPMFKARSGSEKFAPDARGKEPVLPVNVHVVLAVGSKATKNDLNADEDGSVFRSRLP